MEEPGGLQSTGHKESDMTDATYRACMHLDLKETLVNISLPFRITEAYLV